jgi:hypothetical protein
MKAIDTNYKNYYFRSRLEARWAVYFDCLGIKYEYENENERFEMSDGTKYLPDFYLPDIDLYCEVKPNIEISDADMHKIEMFALESDKEIILLKGEPSAKLMQCFKKLEIKYKCDAEQCLQDDCETCNQRKEVNLTQILTFDGFINAHNLEYFLWVGYCEDFSDQHPYKRAIKEALSYRF